eukprot:4963410-Amphidinium_carterae.1
MMQLCLPEAWMLVVHGIPAAGNQLVIECYGGRLYAQDVPPSTCDNTRLTQLQATLKIALESWGITGIGEVPNATVCHGHKFFTIT